jgi:hypothetical protein
MSIQSWLHFTDRDRTTLITCIWLLLLLQDPVRQALRIRPAARRLAARYRLRAQNPLHIRHPAWHLREAAGRGRQRHAQERHGCGVCQLFQLPGRSLHFFPGRRHARRDVLAMSSWHLPQRVRPFDSGDVQATSVRDLCGLERGSGMHALQEVSTKQRNMERIDPGSVMVPFHTVVTALRVGCQVGMHTRFRHRVRLVSHPFSRGGLYTAKTSGEHPRGHLCAVQAGLLLQCQRANGRQAMHTLPDRVLLPYEGHCYGMRRPANLSTCGRRRAAVVCHGALDLAHHGSHACHPVPVLLIWRLRGVLHEPRTVWLHALRGWLLRRDAFRLTCCCSLLVRCRAV